MIARVWRGLTAADFADEVAAHLAEVTLAGYAAAPGNLSTQLLTRPSGGGVELMTVTSVGLGGRRAAAACGAAPAARRRPDRVPPAGRSSVRPPRSPAPRDAAAA